MDSKSLAITTKQKLTTSIMDKKIENKKQYNNSPVPWVVKGRSMCMRKKMEKNNGEIAKRWKRCVLLSLSHYTLMAILACALCSLTEYILQSTFLAFSPSSLSPTTLFFLSMISSFHLLPSSPFLQRHFSFSCTMDAKSAEAASQILKYQTWLLKVPIHCEGCRRKVKKVLQRIDGVFTITIDQQQQKVTVTGSVGLDVLIGKLIKAGKQAEIWPENVTGKGKKKNEQRDPVENHSPDKSESNPNSDKNKGLESAAKGDNKSKPNDSKNGANTTVIPLASNQNPSDGHKGEGTGEADQKSGGGGSGKKKKKKKAGCGGGGNNGSNSVPAPALTEFQTPGQMNISPTHQQSYTNPETYYPPMAYLATYRSYPMGRMGAHSTYYVPSPIPYMQAGQDHEIYQLQSAPLVSFEIFSDENVNGCSIV